MSAPDVQPYATWKQALKPIGFVIGTWTK